MIGAVIAQFHFLGAHEHRIKPVYFVKPFDPTAAIALIAITGVIGYLFGLGAVISL